MPPTDIDPAALSAIDVHVHLEAEESSDTDAAARDYFGDTGAPRDPDGLAEYYRSRRMAFVVFTVDERLSGRRHVTNDDVLRFAAKHADVAMAFISVDPTRGPEAVREAGGCWRPGWCAGSSCIRRCSSSSPTTARRTRSTNCSPKRGCQCCSTRATAASAPA